MQDKGVLQAKQVKQIAQSKRKYNWAGRKAGQRKGKTANRNDAHSLHEGTTVVTFTDLCMLWSLCVSAILFLFAPLQYFTPATCRKSLILRIHCIHHAVSTPHRDNISVLSDRGSVSSSVRWPVVTPLKRKGKIRVKFVSQA